MSHFKFRTNITLNNNIQIKQEIQSLSRRNRFPINLLHQTHQCADLVRDTSTG